MPNRILKESICLSDNIEALSLGAETLFYRLLVKCDDFGRYDGRPAVLRASCFPLRLDRVSEQNVRDWLQELITNDLVWLYQSGGRTYLQVTKWSEHQQTRAQHSKWPQPPEDEGASVVVQSVDSTCNHVLALAPDTRESRIENTIHENTKGAQTKAHPLNTDPINSLVAQFQECLGYPVPSWGPEAQAAKWLLGKYQADDVLGCWRYLQTDPFWQGKYCGLQSVRKQLGAWLQAGRPKFYTNGKGPPVGGLSKKPNEPKPIPWDKESWAKAKGRVLTEEDKERMRAVGDWIGE